MNKGLRLMMALMALFFASSSLADMPPKTPFNPNPAEDDLILPMPDGEQMVFREVVVLGENFWGDPRRIVQVGDGEGDIFEGLQRMQVSGTFPGPDGKGRSYYLGKYELTKGQFIAIMGEERYLRATGDSKDAAQLQGLTGRERERVLAQPLVFVSWSEMLECIHRYNLWLFDPQHSERLADMPKVGDSPGFLRLPTELEWEYAARDGLPALEDGSFKNSLPFPKTKMDSYAWYLKNAKHKLRAVGQRKPSRLGLYDMLGNAQEICEGRFMPEHWQGQPGGLVARGGSVCTQGRDLRASRREEVEVFKWVADEKSMKEWRSYNTGMRLAIGANVVRSTANRSALEKEYLDYHQTMRASMPVGQTLDNMVTQASGQLTAARGRLDELQEQNAHLKSELSRIRQDIEKAQEQLEISMLESARSTLQDLLRVANDLGRDFYKLENFRQRLADVERMSPKYTRFQDLAYKINAEIDKRVNYIDELFVRYGEVLEKLGEFSSTHSGQALDVLEQQQLTNRSRVALGVLREHLEQYRTVRRKDEETWREDFRETFKNLAD